MKYLRWLPLVLVLIAAWNMNLRPHIINMDEELDIPDPAVETMTQDHSEAWGGIDRWAYPGLESWRVVRRLETAGFTCTAPQDTAVGGVPQSGLHRLRCSQEKSWPLSRQLSLEILVSYDLPGGGRLQSAHAQSAIKPAAWREKLASLLRHLHFLEPEKLQVTGLQAASTDDLARIVANALLNTYWESLCNGNTRMSCNSVLSQRGKEGFVAAPTTAWKVSDLRELGFQLANIGFALSGRVIERDNYLPIRVDGDQLWVNMERLDLAGHTEKLAIELDAVGAQPIRLRLEGRSGAREFALAGKNTTYNGDHVQWLFPLMAGVFVNADDELEASGGRKAIWLYPQDMDETGDNLRRFSEKTTFIDPGFQPRLLRAYIDFLLQDNSPEAALKLQPPLQTADRMAAALQRSGIGALLPAAEADTLIQQHYAGPEKVLARAAWALYRCEKSTGQPLMDADCWARIQQQDRAASALLQEDLQVQMQIYSRLDADNPVQQRLRRLAAAYAQTGAP
ncbi:MAG: hypothetical protein ACRERR_03395 [Moraxellaceae bacterium]